MTKQVATQVTDTSIYTVNSWRPKQRLTFDEWSGIVNSLFVMSESINFWIGDALNYGEGMFGEGYAQVVEATGWKVQRLMNCKWICKAIPASVRGELSWTHHECVAKLHPDEQEHWLSLAVMNEWNTREFKQAIREHEDAKDTSETLESFKQGWREAMEGDTQPIDTLWDDVSESPPLTTCTRTERVAQGVNALHRRIDSMSDDQLDAVEELLYRLGLIT